MVPRLNHLHGTNVKQSFLIFLIVLAQKGLIVQSVQSFHALTLSNLMGPAGFDLLSNLSFSPNVQKHIYWFPMNQSEYKSDSQYFQQLFSLLVQNKEPLVVLNPVTLNERRTLDLNQKSIYSLNSESQRLSFQLLE